MNQVRSNSLLSWNRRGGPKGRGGRSSALFLLMKPYIYNSKSLEPNRKELRNALTPAEAFLWTQLKKRQLSGKKFRRQYSVGRTLSTFCPEVRLAVELDGAHTSTSLGRSANSGWRSMAERL